MTSFTLTLSSSDTDFTTYLAPPINLDPCKKYEAAFISLETYNSIPNITENNNIFKYSIDKGETWKIITLPPDAYEFTQIGDEIKRQMIENGDYNKEVDSSNRFYITFSICRLSSMIEILHSHYKVDFGVKDSIGSTLGFSNEILSFGSYKSPKIVDINQVNSILINVDFISGSYVSMPNQTCLQSPSIYNFSPKVGPGFKINERPNPTLIFYPVTCSNIISSVRLWLTDQNNKPINLQGERITVKILIKEKRT